MLELPTPPRNDGRLCCCCSCRCCCYIRIWTKASPPLSPPTRGEKDMDHKQEYTASTTTVTPLLTKPTQARSVPQKTFESFRRASASSASTALSLAANGRIYNQKAAARNTARSPLVRSLKGRHLQMIAIGGSIGMYLYIDTYMPIYSTHLVGYTRHIIHHSSLTSARNRTVHRHRLSPIDGRAGIPLDFLHPDGRRSFLHRAGAR